MKLTLSDQLKPFMRVMQGSLFPVLQEELGPLTEKHRQLVAPLNMIRIELPVADLVPDAIELRFAAPRRRAISLVWYASQFFRGRQ